MTLKSLRTFAIAFLGLALTSPTWASSRPEPDLAALGAGKVTLQIQQARPGDLVLGLETDLVGLAGVLVQLPKHDKALAVITATEAPEAARAGLESSPAEAFLKIGAADLTGTRPQLRIPTDLTQAHELIVTLITAEGARIPVRLHGGDLTRFQVTLETSGLSGKCLKYWLTCSGNTCAQSPTECCTLDVCVDCTTCRVTCGERCTATLPPTP